MRVKHLLKKGGDSAKAILRLNRSKTIKHASSKIGSVPGTLVYEGQHKHEKVKVQVMDYTEGNFKEIDVKKIDDLKKFKNQKTISWINVTGVHNTQIIRDIGKVFSLHPLLMEDVVSTKQRPKVDNYGEHLFVVMKMLMFDSKAKEIVNEQLSLVIGKGYVISFQEYEGDVFDSVRDRIRAKRKKFSTGSDYLAYALIDTIVDHYFLLLEQIGEQIELLEEHVLEDASEKTLATIYALKRELIVIRKSIWPLREMMSSLLREDSRLISRETMTYLRDVYDHTIQVIDTVETFRDMLGGMLDLHMSTISNKMNEVMKVLTVIATIFIPLTFIAGVYGMNFTYMPELTYRYAYFIVWGIMIGVGGVMTWLFRRKGWL